MNTESDTESDPVEINKKEPEAEEDVPKKVLEEPPKGVPEKFGETGNPTISSKKNRGKTIDESSSDDSLEEGDSEKTESEGVEKIEVEDVELLINLKKKPNDKKRKAASSMQRNNPVRKTARKSTMAETVAQMPVASSPA